MNDFALIQALCACPTDTVEEARCLSQGGFVRNGDQSGTEPPLLDDTIRRLYLDRLRQRRSARRPPRS